MSGHHGGMNTTANRLVGIQLQTSAYGGVIPIIYGTTRAAGNLIYYTDFVATPHTTSQNVGKGGGGGSISQTTYTYTACVVLALSEGPIQGVNQIWRDQTVGTMAGYGYTLSTGARTQAVWSYLTSNHPTQACAYSGLALACNALEDLGSDARLKNNSFEVVGILATVQDPNEAAAYDALPSDVVVDMLSNAFYGAGWNPAKIGDLVTGAQSYATYCHAAGFVLSPAFDTQRPGASYLGDILTATNSEAVLHSGATSMVLDIVPYGDTPITANGYTYTPNTTPLYDLTYDDFLGVLGPDGKATGKSPITITRGSTQDVYNDVPVEYLDRSTGYNTSVVDAPEPNDVATYGLKRASTLSLHMITRMAVAQAVSLIQSQKQVYIRNQYTFRVGWRYFLLEPMDLVTLTDPILGLSRKVVRVVSIDFPDEQNEKNGITITAEEWPFGVATATAYSLQNPTGTGQNQSVDPGPASTPLIFNSPALWAENASVPEITIAAAGASALWGGATIWVSTNNTTYSKAGYISSPCRYGTLTAPLAAWSGGTTQDLTNTLSVIMPDGGTLAGTDAASAANGMNLIWVDGEMISYQTATLTGPGAYNLTGLYRGLYGTTPGSHSSGASFAKIDGAIERYQIPAGQVGSMLYIKLQSFNVWGGGGRQLSSETAYTFAPTQQLLPAAFGVTIQIGSTPFI